MIAFILYVYVYIHVRLFPFGVLGISLGAERPCASLSELTAHRDALASGKAA